ncbi:MAG TPA: hypothetical protein VFO49_17160 [Nocardioides sp.]|nr:hypothetical protein [Nocardioides sp.]
MLVRTAVSTAACLAAVLCTVPGPANADGGDGVPVFHDRVVKRDRAGDVAGDGTTPIDIRKVTYDHYKLGDSERLTVTVRFAGRVRRGSELNLGTSTGAGGYPLEFRSTVGGGFRLERDDRVVRRPHVRREVEGRQVTITIPWRKLGSPRNLVGLHFWAILDSPFGGIDKAFKPRAVLR